MTLENGIPDHRLALPGSDGWTVWRTIFLRGAGFAARNVLTLAAPGLCRAVDELLDQEARLADELARAIDACARIIEELQGPERKAVARTLSALRRGQVPAETGAAERVLEVARTASAGVAAARARAQEEFAAAEAALRPAIREAARDPRFQEAVLWQNRTAFELGIEWLLRRPADASDDKTRQKERLVASYMQRYSLKNDTIGFFGPVGWGSISSSGPAIEVRPGPTLLANRTVYFEHWAVDTLADLLSGDLELRKCLAPRLMPSLRLEGALLVDPERGTTSELAALDAQLLGAARGDRSARSIAREVFEDRTLGVASESDVYDALDRLVEKGWLVWRLEIPLMKSHPERSLLSALHRLESPDVEARGVQLLAEMDAARGVVAAAAGNPVRLREALRELDDTFVRLTGRAATRNQGKVYGSRTLVYEDCRRDLELRVGPEILARLGPPLALLLKSGRWYTHAIATQCQAMFRSVYESLGGTSAKGVDYLVFEPKVMEYFPMGKRQQHPLIREVAEDLRARWTRVLALEPGVSRVERSVAEVGARASVEFAAPGPGWPSARFHSPDLMLSARSVDDLARGDYLVVMGELHTSTNTVLSNLAMDQHPNPQELIRARDRDVGPSLLPVPPRRMSGVRALSQSPSPLDYNIEFDDSPSWRDRAQVVAAGELVVRDVEGRLRVGTRDGRLDFDVVQAFQVPMMGACSSHFQIAPSWQHVPRVTVDRMVFIREGWRFDRSELGFVDLESRAERFAGARRWARACGLPRFVFVKTPEELKPWYLDLESPPYVELFAWGARKASSVRVTEMVPGIEETWLPDARGLTYTSELRIVAVDPIAWTPNE